MAEIEANGVRLYYELHGGGEPLALVHGSWADATNWLLALLGLADSFRVLIYDRRGHSRSERPDTAGSFDEDGDDLTALLEELDMVPAHVVTNSSGGNIALRLATRRPDLYRSLSCHEPPLWGVLEDDPASEELLARESRLMDSVGGLIADGDHEGAAKLFVDQIAFGPGAWENELPPEARRMFINNAPTFLDELQSPDQFEIDVKPLFRLETPIRLTNGSESPPIFERAVDRLEDLIPGAIRETFEGAGHVPQVTAPQRYVELTTRALQQPVA